VVTKAMLMAGVGIYQAEPPGRKKGPPSLYPI